jgi:hypothetical protein
LNCLCYYREKVYGKVARLTSFDTPPTFDFPAEDEFCLKDRSRLGILKTDTRMKKTVQIGLFKTRETIKVCPECGTQYRSRELAGIVPPSCNFGYDVLVYVGKALFLEHLADQTIIERLAEKNVEISLSEVGYLGNKFIIYLAVSHRQSAARIKGHMTSKGGYILHLDATYEDKSPLLMTGLDSIMKIVLGNCKLGSEKSDDIVPFLEDIKDLFGEPLATVHDMSKGIIKAVGIVFPDSLDFICQFHFLRDIGKDLLEAEYDNIRKRLSKHGITAKLNYRLRKLKQKIDEDIGLIEMINMDESICSDDLLRKMPVIGAYSLLIWAFEGKKHGNGYGFPFDRPHLEFAKRLRQIHTDLDELRKIRLAKDYRCNRPLHKTFFDLSAVMNDKPLWKSVDSIGTEIEIFDKLRDAMRIAPKTNNKGLNSEGSSVPIGNIKQKVEDFRREILSAKEYSQNELHQKMIAQIDKYRDKLFAEPIRVETADGVKYIQPQRTNNYSERDFRDLKRGYRKKTGNGSLGKKLCTMLADTPLVKNLKNPEYMSILLDGKSSLEELFADIDAREVRRLLKRSQGNPEKVPAKLRKLTKEPDFPKKLKDYYLDLKSNGILC